MLTPNQIKNVMFTKSAVGGYKMSEVDEFILVVCSDYSRLYKENSELLLQVESLNEKVAQYSENEDHIKTTLVTAQKMADKIIGDAKAERENIKESTTREFGGIVGEAKVKANQMVEDATHKANDIRAEAKELSDSLLDDTNRQVDHQQKVLETLRQEISDFREKVLDLFNAQTALVKDLPALEKKIEEEYAHKNKKNKKNRNAQNTENEQPEQPAEAKVSTPILENISEFLNKNFETMKEVENEAGKEDDLIPDVVKNMAEEEPAEQAAEEAAPAGNAENTEDNAEPKAENDDAQAQDGAEEKPKSGDEYDIFEGDD